MIAWVSPVGILQQVLQPERTDVDVHVCLKWVSTLQFSTLIEASTANDNTNTWSTQVKKTSYEPDAGFYLPWYGI